KGGTLPVGIRHWELGIATPKPQFPIPNPQFLRGFFYDRCSKTLRRHSTRTDRPARVFVGVTHDGLYRTIDAGQTWKRVLEGDIRAVAVDPTSDDVVYAGV